MQPASNNARSPEALSPARLNANNDHPLSDLKHTNDDVALGPTSLPFAKKTTSLTLEHEPAVMTFIDDEPNRKLLLEKIIELYKDHERLVGQARQTKGEMLEQRVQLGAKLHELKSVYSKRGRGGRWVRLLNLLGIPRATADRYVREHEKRATPDHPKLLSEAFSEPTPEAISAFVRKSAPKLRAVLTTVASVNQFLDELALALRTS